MIGRAIWHYARAMRNYTLPRADLERLQLKKLKEALALAYREVPYYHDLFRKTGKGPNDIQDLRDIATIPLLKKPILVGRQQELISARRRAPYRRMGSGTTGNIVTLAYDDAFRDVTLALQARHLTNFGMRPWKRLVSIWAPRSYWRKQVTGKRRGESYTWADELSAVAKLGRLSSRFVPLQASQNDPARDLKELVKLRPDFIMCPPSHLARMAPHLEAYGKFTVEGMNLINEGFTTVTARRLERAYGGKALNSLGSNELGVAGADCTFQRGMHLNEDWMLFEVLRDGEQVGEGERGELVATVFSNRAMPLIRYATGDTVELADGGLCECGSPMTRIKRLLGRKDDWIRGAGGALFPPMEVAEAVESRFSIDDYQIVQTGPTEFLVKTPSPEEDERRLSEQLRDYLGTLLGGPVTLTFALRSRRDIWMKYRPVVCGVPQPTRARDP